MQKFRETRRFESKEFTLNVGDRRKVCTTAMENVSLCFDDFRVLGIRNCYYIEEMQWYFIFVFRLLRQNYFVYFEVSKVFIKNNNSLICIG